MNITRAEGEVNVFIPCPLSDTGSTNPIWKINETYYEVYNLPRKFRPATYGILITRVDGGMNGTTFQCIDEHNFESTVGMLTVEQAPG